ncbi:MAG: hypothetical protein ACJAV1_003060, partial [Paraglaciecola sp.]
MKIFAHYLNPGPKKGSLKFFIKLTNIIIFISKIIKL